MPLSTPFLTFTKMVKTTKYGYFIYGFILSVLSLFFSCAVQVAPTGGPKDLSAPQMTESVPLDKTINYNGAKIKFTFDEYIKLVKPKDNIIFSPPIENIKESYVVGKSLFIVLEDTLRLDYTYELLLANAVKDENEGNLLKAQKILFSTGEVLDTLSISGKLVDYKTNKPVKDEKIILHQSSGDSTFYNTYPSYISKTNGNGEFSFNNLREGKYTVYALSDINYNLRFDIPKEKIAFHSDTLTVKIDSFTIDTLANTTLSLDSLLQDSIWLIDTSFVYDTVLDTSYIQTLEAVELLFFEEAKSNRYFKKIKKRALGGYWFHYVKAIDSVKVRCLNDSINFTLETFPLTDSFRLWQISQHLDTVEYVISINNDFIDTVPAYYPPLDSTDKQTRNVLESPLTAKWQNIKPNILFDLTPRLYFNAPIMSIIYDSIQWYEGDSLIAVNMNLDSDQMSIAALYPWKENQKYRVFMRDSVIFDYHGRTLDTLEAKAKTRLYKSFGTLDISIIDSLSRDYVVYFRKGKDILKQYDIQSDSINLHLEYLQPGEYNLQFIWDKNHDNKWSTGKFSEQSQPERFYDYPIQLNVQGGFDIHQEINLSEIEF